MNEHFRFILIDNRAELVESLSRMSPRVVYRRGTPMNWASRLHSSEAGVGLKSKR